jgi:serine/threonine protein kinase
VSLQLELILMVSLALISATGVSADVLARNVLIEASREDLVLDPIDVSLSRLIGTGRSAEVYLGELMDNGDEVAVKQFSNISLATLEKEWQDRPGTQASLPGRYSVWFGDNSRRSSASSVDSVGTTAASEKDDLGDKEELSAAAQWRLERRKKKSPHGRKALRANRFSAQMGSMAGEEELEEDFKIRRKRSGGSTDDQTEGVVHFAREFGIMAGLEHEHILRLRGIILGDSLRGQPLALVTEFCAGGSLFDLLHMSEAPLSWAQRREALLHAARGIEYLHTREPPVIHRDLKPQNLLLKHEVLGLEDEVLLKVADFGLCRTLGAEESVGTVGQLTAGVGTLCYVAPEVMRGPGAYNLQADIYSFGVVIFETLSRETPFACTLNPALLCTRVAEGYRPDEDAGFVPEKETAPDGACPSDLPVLMRRCWAGDPITRPPAFEIRCCLEEVSDDACWDTDTGGSPENSCSSSGNDESPAYC